MGDLKNRVFNISVLLLPYEFDKELEVVSFKSIAFRDAIRNEPTSRK